RPARARVVLGTRIEEQLAAANALIDALVLRVPVFAGESPLGAALPGDVKLLGRQKLPPFFVAFSQRPLLTIHGVLLAGEPPQPVAETDRDPDEKECHDYKPKHGSPRHEVLLPRHRTNALYSVPRRLRLCFAGL